MSVRLLHPLVRARTPEQADKASVGRDLVDRLKRFVDSLDDSTPEAAVSPRSSDGLLPLLEIANRLLEHCEGQKRYHCDKPEDVAKWRNIQTGVRMMKAEIEIRMAGA